MGTVNINGRVYTGDTIVIKNNKTFIDGKEADTADAKEINISVTGDIKTIEVDACNKLEVSGNVTGNVKTMSGDVKCGNVNGSISTMSGDVDCEEVGGSISTMSGSIKHKKQ